MVDPAFTQWCTSRNVRVRGGAFERTASPPSPPSACDAATTAFQALVLDCAAWHPSGKGSVRRPSYAANTAAAHTSSPPLSDSASFSSRQTGAMMGHHSYSSGSLDAFSINPDSLPTRTVAPNMGLGKYVVLLRLGSSTLPARCK